MTLKVVTSSNDSKHVYQSVNHYYHLNLQWTCVSYNYKIMFVNLAHLSRFATVVFQKLTLCFKTKLLSPVKIYSVSRTKL